MPKQSVVTIGMILNKTCLGVKIHVHLINLTIFTHRYAVEEDGTLVIKKLNIEDSGMFQCEAENEAGSDSISTWLKVKSKCA